MSYQITSKFGSFEKFRHKSHKGVDFYMEEGTPLKSIRDGVVESIIDYGNRNAGKCIKIRFEDGNTAIYGHLSKFGSIKEGEVVKAGDLIGYSGHSGRVFGKTGNHLHFGIKNEDGKFINPSSEYINDIQHMNDKGYFVQKAVDHVQKAPEFVKVNFFEYMKQHMNVLQEVKLQFIDVLTNDVMVIQILQQCFQFFSAHSSLFNNVVACIF